MLEVLDSSREGQMALGRKGSVRSLNQLGFRTHEPCGLDLRIDDKSCVLYAKDQIAEGPSAGVLEIDSSLCGSL